VLVVVVASARAVETVLLIFQQFMELYLEQVEVVVLVVVIRDLVE
jgi:hypothetical protein